MENLNLYADLRGVVGDARRRAFERLLPSPTSAASPAGSPGKLSGGMKQKLGLACALIATPQLLLLDEPSVGVDPISRRELWQMVYDAGRPGHRRGLEHGLPRRGRALRRRVAAQRGQAALSTAARRADQAQSTAASFLLRGVGSDRRRVLAEALATARGHRRRDPRAQASAWSLAADAKPPSAAALGARGRDRGTSGAALRGRLRRPARRRPAKANRRSPGHRHVPRERAAPVVEAAA